MKKLKIFIGVFAFMLAIGAAYASNQLVFTSGWKYVTSTPHCISVGNICNGTDTLCFDANSNPIYNSSVPVGTTCGTQLTMAN